MTVAFDPYHHEKGLLVGAQQAEAVGNLAQADHLRLRRRLRQTFLPIFERQVLTVPLPATVSIAEYVVHNSE